ncbi:SirB2 family protein [Paraglaciecola arctica]|uniref:Invasion gene expression up-regulator, SirB n=1 Tax=Paraglaciecola arctica BSs20135 TaxID=493475 RepID=K6ZFI1_9ALTE|nr:SirB2 family protein [Paraglaciecola arctica]GAC22170.1 invasion gene expression up-regulator, SirB [Paraglaciecola arctica BSs20135]
MYLIIKHSHLTLVVISVSFLIIRVIAVSAKAQWLQKKWAKVTPHVIDTFLLATAITLILMIQQYPIVNHWLSAKIIGLFGYILCGALALKGDKSVVSRFSFLLLALSCITYMALVAITKQPLPFYL